MTDARTLAYINMYAIFGTLENLCELDENARALLKNKKPTMPVAFDMEDGDGYKQRNGMPVWMLRREMFIFILALL